MSDLREGNLLETAPMHIRRKLRIPAQSGRRGTWRRSEGDISRDRAIATNCRRMPEPARGGRTAVSTRRLVFATFASRVEQSVSEDPDPKRHADLEAGREESRMARCSSGTTSEQPPWKAASAIS